MSQGLGDIMKCILCIVGIYPSKIRITNRNWLCDFCLNGVKNDLLQGSQRTMCINCVCFQIFVERSREVTVFLELDISPEVREWLSAFFFCLCLQSASICSWHLTEHSNLRHWGPTNNLVTPHQICMCCVFLLSWKCLAPLLHDLITVQLFHQPPSPFPNELGQFLFSQFV